MDTKDHYENIDREVSSTLLSMQNLRMKMCESIHDMINEISDGSVRFREDDIPMVSYDGGNHAEYASTLATEVVGASSAEIGKRKTFALNLYYEEDNYDEPRMLFEDVVCIYDHIRDMYIKKKGLTK